MKRFQFIWWGWSMRWMSFGFHRLDPAKTDLALVYVWTLCLGPVEIRRWVKDVTPDEMERW